jgi:hypothetical protein
MSVGLLGDKQLLNLTQKLLCLGQRHPQVDDIIKTVRPADRHHVETSGLTINPHPNQTQRPFHAWTPSRQHTRLSYPNRDDPPDLWTVPWTRTPS